MAEAKEKSQWTQTATVLSLIANVNRDSKKTPPFKPDDFFPFAIKTAKENTVIRSSFTELKKILKKDGKCK